MIDFHCHPFLIREIVGEDETLHQAIRDGFRMRSNLQPLQTLFLEMDAADIDRAVLVPVDCHASRGYTLFTNEQVASLCREHDRFLGLASVDPQDPAAPDQLNHAVRDLGLKGVKLDPGLQDFSPTDEAVAYPVFEAAQDLEIPVLMHAGLSWAPESRVNRGCPMALEQVACDFPGLNLVIAHFGWPWVLESVALALKYPNVYLDTSAHYLNRPQEFLDFILNRQIPPRAVERSLRTKVVFGSNYPRIEIRKMATALRQVGLTPGCLKLIFEENARRLLHLEH